MAQRAPFVVAVAAAGSLVGGVGASGCRLDADCFGTDECSDGQICLEGQCIEPPAPTRIDAGFVTLPDGGLTPYTWLADVEPIVRVRCAGCHGRPPVDGAQLSIVDYADTQATAPNGQPVHVRMAVRASDTANPHPASPPEPRLSELEIRILVEWSGQGAPPGEIPDAGVPVDAGPDAGFPDSGFFDGGPNGAMDPLTQIGEAAVLPGTYDALDGLVWSSAINTLYFCDVGTNIIYRYDPAQGAPGPFIVNSSGASGIGLDPQGVLIIAEQRTRRVVRNDANMTPIATEWMADLFNSPDDVEVRSDGVIFFTDPPFGLTGQRELSFNGLFRISTLGAVVPDWEGEPESTGPNGLALSPDEGLLYMSDSSSGVVRVFDVAMSGVLSDPLGFKLVAGEVAGGMDVDRDGNLYVATTAGIEVFAPSGFKWGTIFVGNTPTNVVFGGTDFRTLFVTATNEVFAYPVGIPGVDRRPGN